MLLAIISDSHDNLATLAKFLAYARENKVHALIHCGDVATGETLDYIASQFGGRIYLAEGNMDNDHQLRQTAAAMPKKISYFDDFGKTTIAGLKLGFCHHKETALQHLKKENYDFVFYGHTHKPWLETVNGSCLANPGNLSGTFYKATFATLDAKTKSLDLKIVENLKI